MTTAAALYERPSKRPSAAPHVSLFADSSGDAAGAGGGGLPVSILLDEVVVGEEDDGGGGGGFDQAPELIMGTLAASMAKGVEQGEEKGLEERDAGIRWEHAPRVAEMLLKVYRFRFAPKEGRPHVLLIVLYGPAAVFRHRRMSSFKFRMQTLDTWLLNYCCPHFPNHGLSCLGW